MKRMNLKIPLNEKGIIRFLNQWTENRTATLHIIHALHEYILKNHNVISVVEAGEDGSSDIEYVSCSDATEEQDNSRYMIIGVRYEEAQKLFPSRYTKKGSK